MDPTRLEISFFPIIETIGFFTPNTHLHCRNQSSNLQLWLSLKDKCLTRVPRDPYFFQVSYSWVTGVCSWQKTARTWLWGLVITQEQNMYLLLSPKSQEYEDKYHWEQWISHTHTCTHIHTHTHTGTIAYCFEVKHLKALFPLSRHVTLAACM